MTYKGIFKPTNPKKYIGDSSNIIYRSRWELVFMNYLDSHKDVKRWASEELVIPYISPVDNRIHRYFPDFWVEKINREGKKDIVVIEIKPHSQTQQPKKNKRSQRYLYEMKTWAINNAKWEAAKKYCKDKNWQFMIMTEKELGIKF